MENKRMFLGIDPGSKGAFGFVNEDGSFSHHEDIPKIGTEYNLQEINRIIKEHEIHFAAIEFQQVFGKEGLVSAFKIGYGYGILVMALEANGIPYVEVRPQAWKKVFSLVGKDKKFSVRLAQRFFPTGVFTGPRGGIFDGRAESCLVGEYARRMSLQLPVEKHGFFE